MNAFLLFSVVLFGILFGASAFTCEPTISTTIRCNSQNFRAHSNLIYPQHYNLRKKNSNTILSHSKDDESKGEPYLQHICPSCSYIYDEEKGFKKRHPPGEKSTVEIKWWRHVVAEKLRYKYHYLTFLPIFVLYYHFVRCEINFNRYKTEGYSRFHVSCLWCGKGSMGSCPQERLTFL